MDLETVKALPMADQMTFLRGRIVDEALRLEAAARYLHVRLNGASDLDAALDTPQHFKSLIAECAELVPHCERLHDGIRPVALDAIITAGALYQLRNRFVHDVLRTNLVSEQAWEMSKISRPKSEVGNPLPDPEPVSAEDMIVQILEIIRTTWRLRGVIWSMIGSSRGISPFLTHPFAPQWDGTFLYLDGAPR
ncbi:hypothetical protein [Clavibacter sp. Sh2088]|uniref:hypothetical protein n=1 Tax=Clavibacter sp. Sh2088 TaxID=3397676 RepID=UPI0039E169AC